MTRSITILLCSLSIALLSIFLISVCKFSHLSSMCALIFSGFSSWWIFALLTINYDHFFLIVLSHFFRYVRLNSWGIVSNSPSAPLSFFALFCSILQDSLDWYVYVLRHCCSTGT